MMQSYLFEFLLLSTLELFLEEQHHLLDVPARDEAENNADSLSSHLQVGALWYELEVIPCKQNTTYLDKT